MGKRGPTPTPHAVLKLAGARETSLTRKRNCGDGVLTELHTPGRPDSPDFGDDVIAAALWLRLVDQMAEIGMLGKVDAQALERYCRLWSRWCELEAAWPRGEEPSGKILAVSEQLLRIEQQFGMTPASRVRKATAKPKADEAGAEKSRFFSAG